jgi:4-hydroxy-3-methylbut-2-enyl diphosphate reductase
MEVIIDPHSGFCFGVKRAVELAEKEAASGIKLYCLGEIVHNAAEVDRLRSLGIEFIDRTTFLSLSSCRVMIRAHGEPPETYLYAIKNNIELLDATCPVVIKLQEKVKNARKINPHAQVVIYGKRDHPELIGLNGQIDNAIIIESIDEISVIDFSRPVSLFAQTTKDKAQYAAIKHKIFNAMKEKGMPDDAFVAYNSICGQVANRAPWLDEFSRTVDALIFVGGRLSSNSKVLFEVCRRNNPHSYFITTPSDLDTIQLAVFSRIGITGATSTPSWLIDEVAEKILQTDK